MNFSKIFLFVLAGLMCASITQAAEKKIEIKPIIPPQPDQQSPFGCFTFTQDLQPGNRTAPVRYLQFFLQKEKIPINEKEFGVYGITTYAAVKTFQELYNDDIKMAPSSKLFGLVEKATRKKLNELYACGVKKVIPTSQLKFTIKNISLTTEGVIATFCNQGKTTITVFPVRLRLNGINRDFDVVAAHAPRMCHTHSFSYSTWGLVYDPEITYSVVTLIDPQSGYKGALMEYPLEESSSLYVRSLEGQHLTVRSIVLQQRGLQATFCNAGTEYINNFIAKIKLNGVDREFDIPEVRKPWKCATRKFNFQEWNLRSSATTTYQATIMVGSQKNKANINEFTNSAAIIGVL